MIALLGDSHTRSYRVSDYVSVRVFLAKGRENNFTGLSNFALTTARYIRTGRRLKKAGLALGFVIGEPDVRWVVYGKWIIGDADEILDSDESLRFDARAIAEIAARLRHFLMLTRLFGCRPAVIIGCGTPNPQMVQACLHCNEQFRLVCADSGCLFFDPQRNASGSESGIDQNFVGYSVFDVDKRDHTHLSAEISQAFEDFVAEHSERFEPAPVDWRERASFARRFVEIRDFNTYRPVEPAYVKFVDKIRQRISSVVHRVVS